MPSDVNVNMMTVVHASSQGMYTGFPDPCKTPTPGGPVPMPYPNIAMSKDTMKGTTTVKANKKNVCRLADPMMSNGG